MFDEAKYWNERFPQPEIQEFDISISMKKEIILTTIGALGLITLVGFFIYKKCVKE